MFKVRTTACPIDTFRFHNPSDSRKGTTRKIGEREQRAVWTRESRPSPGRERSRTIRNELTSVLRINLAFFLIPLLFSLASSCSSTASSSAQVSDEDFIRSLDGASYGRGRMDGCCWTSSWCFTVFENKVSYRARSIADHGGANRARPDWETSTEFQIIGRQSNPEREFCDSGSTSECFYGFIEQINDSAIVFETRDSSHSNPSRSNYKRDDGFLGGHYCDWAR